MKIGIDIRLIGKKQTGSEAVFFNLVKNLAQIDHENEYFLFTDRDPEKHKDLKNEIEKLKLQNNFEIIFINSPNRFWWNLWALPNYLGKNPIDIFHTQYIAPFWLPKNVKLVLTIHDISFNFYPQFIKFSDLLFLKMLIPRSLKMAAKIIAVSDFTKKEIKKYYSIPAKNIVPIHNGVDFDFFGQKINQEKLESVRQKYNLPKKFILYIGTLQPRKNIPLLIEAVKILVDNHNLRDTELVIAGNRKAHNFDSKIDEKIKNYNLQKSVIFPGWVDEKDKPAFYQLAECFVFPSLYEGFGIPIIEAMAAGTPVICSNQPALTEVGRDAILAVDPLNPEKMAAEIYGILTDSTLREKHIEKGRKLARIYSWNKNAEKTLQVYNRLKTDLDCIANSRRV